MLRRLWTATLGFTFFSRAPHPELVHEEKQQDYFTAIISELVADTDGVSFRRAPLESILFALKPSFERAGRHALLIDAGANVGAVTLQMARIFREYMFYLEFLDSPFIIYAFEPTPKNFHELLERVALLGSQHTQSTSSGRQVVYGRFGIVPVQAALSNETRMQKFTYRPSFYDTRASLGALQSLLQYETTTIDVQVYSLDDYFTDRTPIHFLKIDCEGFDGLVIQGARRLLSHKRIKFLAFEHGPHWAEAGHGVTLQHTLAELSDFGYMCFMITIEALVPISGPWWYHLGGASVLMKLYGDIFCGLVSDNDLFQAYVGFGTNNYTLPFALNNLRTVRKATSVKERP